MLIVEGVSDWITATRLNEMERRWGAVLGAPGEGFVAGIVKRLTLEGINNIVLALDADNGGREGTQASQEAWREVANADGQQLLVLQGLAEGHDITDHRDEHGWPSLASLMGKVAATRAPTPEERASRECQVCGQLITDSRRKQWCSDQCREDARTRRGCAAGPRQTDHRPRRLLAARRS